MNGMTLKAHWDAMEEIALQRKAENEMELRKAIDILGNLHEDYVRICDDYDAAKRRISQLANLINDDKPLTLQGEDWRVVYSASSVTLRLAATPAKLLEVGGLECFAPAITACRKVLVQEELESLFTKEFGSRKLKSVSRYRK